MSDVGEEVRDEEVRDKWSSRSSFIFASVGAAVGFGNVWRFPALAYEFGGGAFFIPYLLALFVIGIPLLILELALGQYYRTGDMGAFGGMHARLRGIGVASVGCSFGVVLYYVPLIAWTANAFFSSFTDFDKNYRNSTGDGAYVYWMDDIIGMSTLDTENFYPTRVMWGNFGCLVLVYAIILACTAFGMGTTGKITYFTMGFPILLLFIFLIKALTLEGAGAGVKAYIGMWDMSVLSDKKEVWSRAVSQIFFSIGVTFGVFTAFGSGCPKDAPIVANSFIIALSNSIFSVISGFAIYAVIGNLAVLRGGDSGPLPIANVTNAGPGLVFGTYPVALAQLNGGEHWVRLFFIFLFLLGIDSGFALFESFTVVLYDTVLGDKYSKRTIQMACGVIGILVGILFITDAGFILLDVVDWYINFILLLVGFLEVFGAGWIFGIEDQIKEIGSAPVISFMSTFFGSVIIACGIWFGVGSIGYGFLALAVSFITGMGPVLKLCQDAAVANNKDLNDVITTLTMGNVMVLRERLSTNTSTLPVIWAVAIKHVIPPLLLICFANLCAGGNFFKYGGYVTAYQVLGLLIVLATLLLFLVGVFVPEVYGSLLKIEIMESVDRLNGKSDSGSKEIEA
eukprot:CAMPEP_0194303210 /NCGR_PEP_ID=MMETSP0171-20130528/1128_1 /TAXON_ID=218684 /ORGANISM="Corethron pennatum, Strain L29A3" /LENGTH=623 /DNA_ID=CAMNT_0039054029 /DNA_START=11 /DNA_END=1882 /DNA_ORIENTATION=+